MACLGSVQTKKSTQNSNFRNLNCVIFGLRNVINFGISATEVGCPPRRWYTKHDRGRNPVESAIHCGLTWEQAPSPSRPTTWSVPSHTLVLFASLDDPYKEPCGLVSVSILEKLRCLVSLLAQYSSSNSQYCPVSLEMHSSPFQNPTQRWTALRADGEHRCFFLLRKSGRQCLANTKYLTTKRSFNRAIDILESSSRALTRVVWPTMKSSLRLFFVAVIARAALLSFVHVQVAGATSDVLVVRTSVPDAAELHPHAECRRCATFNAQQTNICRCECQRNSTFFESIQQCVEDGLIRRNVGECCELYLFLDQYHNRMWQNIVHCIISSSSEIVRKSCTLKGSCSISRPVIVWCVAPQQNHKTHLYLGFIIVQSHDSFEML